MESQSNRIQALVFKQFEMMAYSKELAYTKKLWNKDRLILELSRTNAFGQNWLLPIGILIICTVFFGLLLAYLNDPTGYYNQDDFLLKNAAVIPQLLNPTHTVTGLFNDDTSNNFALQTLDVLFKAVYAFLVFQIVFAFRKYFK